MTVQHSSNAGPSGLQRGLSATFHSGSQVWVPLEAVGRASSKDKRRTVHWRRGVVQAVYKQADGETLVDVVTEEGQELAGLPASDCCLQNERDDTVDDLVKSDFLHEPGILHTLRVRYGLDSIYTYSGNILIAANPHKRLRQLYGPRMMAQYRGVPLGELSPHVYAIAEQAYSAMMMDEQRQAILISGESGAGKTESAKMVMQYLAHRAMPAHFPQHVVGGGGLARTTSNGQAAAASATNGVESAPIEEQVLESNPLLEAFGNAKTSRNDNSSRFGKFVEIDFDAGGRVSGASIATYLLERSRVVSIKAPERSYHIFYQLCAGASDEQRQELGLAGGAASFRYLNRSDVYTLTDVDDAEEFRHTLEAMRIVGLQQRHVDAVLRTVAGVLHLGNVDFVLDSRDEAEVAGPASVAALEAAARLLGVSDVGLEAALTTRAIDARGERIVKRLDAVAAVESRDALAKTLYARLFDWLVAAINKKIGSLGSGSRAGNGSGNARRIGILDIYGFESFDSNSFEQLCINLANERLQQQFNAHVFKGEQEEYAREGIAWSYIDFVDNQDCLDLLEGGSTPNGLGVFLLIDEACRLPRATYQDLAHTLRTRLAGLPRFAAPKRAQHAFAVEHYAGEVVYSTEHLMDKNKDFVVAEHAHLLGSSSVTIIRELFAADAAAAATGGAAADSLTSSAATELPSPKKTDPRAGRKSAFMLSSVGARFRRQLAGLMSTLSQCQPHYIRCVKPNPESRPGSLVPEYVLEQLRAGGVLEAVRIACAGFPTRKPFMHFAQRYALLLPEAPTNGRAGPSRPGSAASAVSERSNGTAPGLPLTASGFIDWFALNENQTADLARRVLYASQLDGWQLGKSRVFLRAGQLAQLEGARGRRLSVAAVRIQAAWRGMEARQLLRRSRAAATVIQAAWRGHEARRCAQRLREERAATRLQSAWRMHRHRSSFLLQRRVRAATTIQSYVRMQQQRRRFLRDTELGKKQAARAAEEARRTAAAVTIQAVVRRRLAQKQATRLRREAQKLRDLQAARDSLAAHAEELRQQLTAALQRAERAEGEAANLKAQVASLTSELQAAQLQARTAQAAAVEAAAATAASATAADAARAAAAAELEAAHRRTAEALQSEIEVLRQQYAVADAARQQREGEVRELQLQVKSTRVQLEAVVANTKKKDDEYAELWKQVKAVEAEFQRELAEKDATLAAIEAAAAEAAAGAELERRELQQQVASQEAAAQAEVAAAQQEAEAARSQAVTAQAAAQQAQQAALREAEEKHRHLAARVVALDSRTQRLEADLRAAATREQQLQEELQAAKRAATALQRSPSKIGALPITPRTLSGQFEAAGIPAVPAQAPPSPATSLSLDRTSAVEVLRVAAVQRQLQVVQVPLSASGPSLRIPLSSWLLCESLIGWAKVWGQPEIDAAADILQRAIVEAAAAGGLRAQAYWLTCTLAAGGLLKARTFGLPYGSKLFRLGNSLVTFTAVHEALGDSVADMLPVNVAVLLSEDAKRNARQRGAGQEISPSRERSPWRALLGGVGNVLEVLRAEGVPAPTVRGVAWACLRYIDGELLNALLLRRDCCSVSAAKALMAGLAELHDWVAYEDKEWVCRPEEAEAALERITQAARYLVQGKEDCARKAAYRGMDIAADLMRTCPALSLPQVYKLTEHQHDDWIVGASSGRESMALLETLQRLMAASTSGELSGEELDLLADPREAFVLQPRALTEGARCFVQPSPQIALTVGGATPARPSAAATPGIPATPAAGGAASPLRAGALSAAPRLPDGSLPAAAATPASPAMATPAVLSQGALFDKIRQACLATGLPSELDCPEFEFLLDE